MYAIQRPSGDHADLPEKAPHASHRSLPWSGWTTRAWEDPTRRTKTTDVPSGDQAGAESRPRVRRRTRRPSAPTIQIPRPLVGMVQARSFPSDESAADQAASPTT